MASKWIEKLYFGFLLLLPLVFCTTIVDSVLLPRQILLTGFVLILAAILIVNRTALQFNFKNPLLYAIAGFLFFNLVSVFNADVKGEAHGVFSKLLIVFSFFLITAVLLKNGIIRTNQLITAVILFGLITVSFPLFEIYQKSLRGQELLRQIELIRGNAANKNLLSSVLFLCLPFYFIGLQQNTAVKILASIGIISTLFVLVTIRTRVVLIAIFIFLSLLLFYKIKQRFSIKKKYLIGFGATFLMLPALFYLFYFRDKVAATQNSTNSYDRYLNRVLDSKTLDSRILFWKNSIQMWQENPIFGVGLGNWQVQFPKYGLNNFTQFSIVNGEDTLQRPHNDFIWILCETGILGLLAYLAIFVSIFYQLYFLIRKAETSAEKWKFLFILSALAGYMLISFFDFPYERIEHQSLLMLLFAITASAYCESFQSSKKNNNPLLFVLLIPVGYSALVSFYRFDGERHAVKMYTAKANNNWSETIFESKKANSYFYPLDNTSMPLTWYEGIGHFNENRAEESQECFEKAYKLTPYNIQVMTNLASTYQANGKLDEAALLFNEALKISKNFDEAKLSLAGLYFNKKEYDKAFAVINEIEVTSKNPKYKLYLAAILNQKINAYLKTTTDKAVIDNLVKNITTKEALLQLFFDAKKNNISFESYLAKARF